MASRRISVIIEQRGASKVAGEVNRLNSILNWTSKVATTALGAIGNAIWKYRYRIMAAVSALGYFAVRSYSTFDDTMMRTKVALRATDAEVATLRERALQIAKDMPYAASTVANAMLAIGRAGFEVADVTEMIIPVLNLAKVADIELGDAADYTSHIIRQWSMDAKEASHVADVLALSEQLATGTITDLAEALQYVGPGAAQANISLEETSAMLLTMANAGIEGSMAGRALRTAFTRFERIKAGATTPLMKLAFWQLGKDVRDAVKEVQKGNMTFLEFVQTISKANPSLGQMSFIFESTASQALLALGQMTDRTKEMNAALLQSKGYAQQSADTLNKDFKNSLANVKTALEALGIKILTPIFQGMQNWIQTKLKPWIDEVTETWETAGGTWEEKLRAVWDVHLKPALEDTLAAIGKWLGDNSAVIGEWGWEIGKSLFKGIAVGFYEMVRGGAVSLWDLLTGKYYRENQDKIFEEALAAERRKKERDGAAAVAAVQAQGLILPWLPSAADFDKRGLIPEGDRAALGLQPKPPSSFSMAGQTGWGQATDQNGNVTFFPTISGLTTAVTGLTGAVVDNTAVTEDSNASAGQAWLNDKATGFLEGLANTLLSAVTEPITASLKEYLSPTSDRIGTLTDTALRGLDIPMSLLNQGLDMLIDLLGGAPDNAERLTKGGSYQYAMAGAGGGGVSASSALHVGTIQVNGVKDGNDAAEKTVQEIAAYNDLSSRNTARSMKRGMVKREAQER